MGGEKKPPRAMWAQQLAGLLWQDPGGILLLDCRPITDYHLLHVVGSVNLSGSRQHRRQLLQKLLPQPCQMLSQQRKTSGQKQVVVYDQGSQEPSASPVLSVVLEELQQSANQVSLLEGGFAEFLSWYPSLCEGRSSSLLRTSISQPCLSTSAVSVTCVLPHLYLGCQSDVLNQDVVGLNGITHVLNVSCSCPQPSFIPSNRFLRIPVNDSYSENILPWLAQAAGFIDKVEVLNGKVLLHCLAGVSRSAAFAIAYVMYSTGLPLDKAYRFVKEKRPSISPNFNFLGQLLEYEAILSCSPSLEAALQPLHADALTPQWGNWDHHCCLQQGLGAKGPTCLSCITCSSVEVAEEASERDTFSLVNQLNALEISLENRRTAQTMKRSFSLDVKSIYTPLSSPGTKVPTGSSMPSRLSSVPKSQGMWNQLFRGGFSLFSLFSDIKSTQDKPKEQAYRSRTSKKPVDLSDRAGQQKLEKAPESFTRSRAICKPQAL